MDDDNSVIIALIFLTNTLSIITPTLVQLAFCKYE